MPHLNPPGVAVWADRGIWLDVVVSRGGGRPHKPALPGELGREPENTSGAVPRQFSEAVWASLSSSAP